MAFKIFLALLILNLNASQISFAVDSEITPQDNKGDCLDCKMRLPSRYGKRNSLMISELPINELIDKYGEKIIKFLWRNKYISVTRPKHLQSLIQFNNTLDFIRLIFHRNKITNR
jgi:hypothetical protein